ncbi:MAG: hypothetical protein MRECE_44c001, partial [Mycoplasmataceae bacterium CE_OT135]
MNNNFHTHLHEQDPPQNQPNRPCQILQLLEAELQNLITDKRTLKAKFQAKMQEIETTFHQQTQEIKQWFAQQWK